MPYDSRGGALPHFFGSPAPLCCAFRVGSLDLDGGSQSGSSSHSCERQPLFARPLSERSLFAPSVGPHPDVLSWVPLQGICLAVFCLPRFPSGMPSLLATIPVFREGSGPLPPRSLRLVGTSWLSLHSHCGSVGHGVASPLGTLSARALAQAPSVTFACVRVSAPRGRQVRTASGGACQAFVPACASGGTWEGLLPRPR